MNHEQEQKCVEKLKTTWTTIGGLTLDEKMFIEKNIRSCVEIDIYGCETEAELPIRIGALIRLKADFQIQEPARRWYCNELRKLHENSIKVFKGDIEVPASDIEYVRDCLKRPDIAEFEYRMTTAGCGYINFYGQVDTQTPYEAMAMRFVRKAKPVAKMVQKFVEYPITIQDGHFYVCGLVHIPDHCSLHELPSMVGFTGEILFQCSNKTKEWKAWGHEMTMCSSDGVPATPIAARFYITE